MAYEIEFTKDDTLNKTKVTKGTVVKVSRSIRDEKLATGVAKNTKKAVVK